MLLERWWFKVPIHSSGRLLSWKKEGWGWGVLTRKICRKWTCMATPCGVL